MNRSWPVSSRFSSTVGPGGSSDWAGWAWAHYRGRPTPRSGSGHYAERVNVALVVPLTLSASGVAVAAVAFWNRDKPAWQRDMPKLLALAIGQVALGAVSWLMLSGAG